MRQDSLKTYVAIRQKLLAEKAALEARLVQLNRALGAETSSAQPAPAAPRKGRAPGRPAKAAAVAKPTKRPKRAANSMSLKEAVIKVTSAQALSKKDILKALSNVGYKFGTKTPMRSLNTLLYTGNVFKNKDGKFCPA